ncbi:N-acylglucosamine 2-epimerase [Opitutaceae bacterium TAV5]|nr:N-acylglucosamine 2-epimerase [Opitutaceae bacterium TAV5]
MPSFSPVRFASGVSLCFATDDGVAGVGSRTLADWKVELGNQLDRTLAFWTSPRLRDERHGGFLVFLDEELRPTGRTEKNLIVHLRMLYNYALALHRCREPARRRELQAEYERQFRFLVVKFHDKKDGGWHWELNRDGSVADPSKVGVGEIYAIYILAELFRMIGDPEAREYARKTFELIEARSADPLHGGYFDRRDLPPAHRLNLRKQSATHLHMILALARLYRSSPRDIYRRRAQQLIDIMCTRFHAPNGNGYYALTRDFRPIEDARPWENGQFNTITCYGHNMEMLWYVLDAVQTFGGEPASLRPWWENLMSGFFEYGLRDGVGVNYIGPPDGPTRDTRILWWSQNEAMITLMRLYEVTGEENYLRHFERITRWSFDNMARDGTGCWFSVVDMDGHRLTGENYRGGTNWKVDFHVVRALRLCLRSLDRIMAARAP